MLNGYWEILDLGVKNFLNFFVILRSKTSCFLVALAIYVLTAKFPTDDQAARYHCPSIFHLAFCTFYAALICPRAPSSWYSSTCESCRILDMVFRSQSSSCKVSVSSRALRTSSTSLGSLMPHTPPPLRLSFPRIPTSLPTRFLPTLPGPIPIQRRTCCS